MCVYFSPRVEIYEVTFKSSLSFISEKELTNKTCFNIVERGTKSLRSLKEGAVYDEGKRSQMRDWC